VHVDVTQDTEGFYKKIGLPELYSKSTAEGVPVNYNGHVITIASAGIRGVSSKKFIEIVNLEFYKFYHWVRRSSR